MDISSEIIDVLTIFSTNDECVFLYKSIIRSKCMFNASYKKVNHRII